MTVKRTDRPPTTTTRREFLSGSSALLAGVGLAGGIAQTACSGGGANQGSASSNTTAGAATVALAAQPTTTNYSPRCWLVASDLVNAGLADGANVLQWEDRTDNSFDLQFQAKIADVNGVWPHLPPTLVANAVNNLPAVSFAASQKQTLIWAPGGALDQELDGFSAVFVIRPDTSVIYDAAYLFITHEADQSTRLAIVFNPTQGGVRAIFGTGGVEYNLPAVTSSSKGIAFGAPNAPVWGILSLRVWYGLNPNATLQVDSVSSSITLDGAQTSTTPSYLDVLCSTSEINHLTCQIAEIAFYPGFLSDAQLSQIAAGLQTKYALPA